MCRSSIDTVRVHRPLACIKAVLAQWTPANHEVSSGTMRCLLDLATDAIGRYDGSRITDYLFKEAVDAVFLLLKTTEGHDLDTVLLASLCSFVAELNRWCGPCTFIPELLDQLFQRKGATAGSVGADIQTLYDFGRTLCLNESIDDAVADRFIVFAASQLATPPSNDAPKKGKGKGKSKRAATSNALDVPHLHATLAFLVPLVARGSQCMLAPTRKLVIERMAPILAAHEDLGPAMLWAAVMVVRPVARPTHELDGVLRAVCTYVLEKSRGDFCFRPVLAAGIAALPAVTSPKVRRRCPTRFHLLTPIFCL